MHALPVVFGLTALALPLMRPLMRPLAPTPAAPVAQEETPQEEETPPTAAPAQEAHPALRALAAATGTTTLFSGTIESIEPERPKGLEEVLFFAAGGGEFSEMMGGPGFTGEVWVWRGDTGETLIVSANLAPGFAIYRDGSVYLTRTLTKDGDALRLEQVAEDLWSVVDLEALFGGLRKAEFKVPEGAAPDSGRYRAEVAKKARRGSTSPFDPASMMGSRILRSEAEITVHPDTKVMRSVVFDVVRNNPFGGMIMEVGEMEVIEEEPPKPIDIPAGGDIEEGEFFLGLEDFDSDAEGATTRISLKTVDLGETLPKRVAAALQEMRAVAEDLEGR